MDIVDHDLRSNDSRRECGDRTLRCFSVFYSRMDVLFQVSNFYEFFYQVVETPTLLRSMSVFCGKHIFYWSLSWSGPFLGASAT